MLPSFFTYFNFSLLIYFNFELLINIHIAKFYKMNCTFSLNNYKNILNEQSRLGWTVPQKLFTWRTIIPPLPPILLGEISPALRWDLTYVGWIHSHINDLFLQSELHHSTKISLKWNISPGRGDFSHINSSLLWNNEYTF